MRRRYVGCSAENRLIFDSSSTAFSGGIDDWATGADGPSSAGPAGVAANSGVRPGVGAGVETVWPPPSPAAAAKAAAAAGEGAACVAGAAEKILESASVMTMLGCSAMSNSAAGTGRGPDPDGWSRSPLIAAL